MSSRLIAALASISLLCAACSADGDENESADPTPAESVPDDTIAAGTPLSEPTAEPSPTPIPDPGQLTVTDTALVGTVGDEFLSLAEAVQVANGSLPVADLSEAEASLVAGDPGADVADTIVVAADGALIAPGGNVWQIELFANVGDTIDGGGVTITQSDPDDGESRNVFIVGSSDVTIEGFSFEGIHAPISVESAGGELTGVRITGNTFVDTLFEDVVVRSSVSGGSMVDLEISGNSFLTTANATGIHRFISVFAALPAGEQVNAASIEGLRIADNAISAGDNSAATCVSVHAGGGTLASAGDAANATATGIEISGNSMSGCQVGISLNAGVSLQQRASVTGSTVSDVTIENNTLSGQQVGLSIRGAASVSVAEFEAAPESVVLTGNTIEGVTIIGTTFSGFETGIELVGGRADFDDGHDVSGNRLTEVAGSDVSMTDVEVPCVEVVDLGAGATGNTLDASCTGIEISS